MTRSLAGYENCTTGGSALAWPPRDLSAVTLRDTQPQPSGLPQNAKILTHSRVFTWSSCTKITGFCSFFCLFTEFGGVQASRSRHGRFSPWGHLEMGRLPSVRVLSRSCLDPSHGTKVGERQTKWKEELGKAGKFSLLKLPIETVLIANDCS